MEHARFILTPITNILSDVSKATSGVGSGIETFPLYDYIFPSVFLKMTGAQEQKMKCIRWDIATYDYEYRYKMMSGKSLGEHSDFEAKTTVYIELLAQIQKLSGDFDPNAFLNKREILARTSKTVKEVFDRTNLTTMAEKNFNNHKLYWEKISIDCFAKTNKNLLAKADNTKGFGEGQTALAEIYKDHLYKHRNRIAHNTLSYQNNLPTLNTLMQDSYIYDNYFTYFATLILIDNIFISLYKTYLEARETF
ncbi:MAG TPA: hypothetical protein DCR37_01400 [Glaciecola sp.]|nr:hypothetical protein [Glaciecola sp.]